MIMATHPKAAVLSLMLSFGAATIPIGFSGFMIGRDLGRVDGREAAQADFIAAGKACVKAEREAGALFGDYVLGENGVDEAAVDDAERRAADLCAGFSLDI